MMNVEMLESIPAKENPFWHDAYHMGTKIASNLMVMHHTHSTEKARYIIVVNTETGERMKIHMEEKEKEKKKEKVVLFHEFRIINGVKVVCAYCGIEQWKTEPEEECPMLSTRDDE